MIMFKNVKRHLNNFLIYREIAKPATPEFAAERGGLIGHIWTRMGPHLSAACDYAASAIQQYGEMKVPVYPDQSVFG